MKLEEKDRDVDILGNIYSVFLYGFVCVTCLRGGGFLAGVTLSDSNGGV